jgi:hypothetical protein
MIDVSADDVYVVFYDDEWVTKNFGVYQSYDLACKGIQTHTAKGYDASNFTVEKWPVIREIE